MTTAIPYARESWSVVTGCSSRICPWCWSRAIAHRFGRSFKPTFHPEKLVEPLHWKKPRTVVVAFNGDLFDPAITDEQIAAVFGVMAATPQHRYIVLTKRAERMAAWFKWVMEPATVEPCVPDPGLICADALYGILRGVDERSSVLIAHGSDARWPLPNVWLGVSVTNQADADERIPHLLRCPAAVRWLSVEPLLGPVRVFEPGCPHAVQTPSGETLPGGGIDWIAAGFQSGRRSGDVLPDVEWARSLRDQCASARVAFAWKDPTGFPPLDGVVHDAMPGGRP